MNSDHVKFEDVPKSIASAIFDRLEQALQPKQKSDENYELAVNKNGEVVRIRKRK